MEQFGPMIRELRLSKGLTLNELAKDIVSVPFLSKYERGEVIFLWRIFFN